MTNEEIHSEIILLYRERTRLQKQIRTDQARVAQIECVLEAMTQNYDRNKLVLTDDSHKSQHR